MPQSRTASPARGPATSARPATAYAALLLALICAGCGRAPTPRTAFTTRTPATATPPADCSTFAPDPVSPPPQIPFALPPNTVWKVMGGAAGAGFYLACTPGATPDAIDTFLNASLPGAGWRRWDPQTASARGCGTESNGYWRWSKGGEAVGWAYDLPLPSWRLVFCDLAYGS